MDRYLVISPHTNEECKLVIEQVEAAGYLTHMDWGCLDHDHTGYAEIEAESHEQALMLVPALVRRKAKAVKVVRFDPKEGSIDSQHAKKQPA